MERLSVSLHCNKNDFIGSVLKSMKSFNVENAVGRIMARGDELIIQIDHKVTLEEVLKDTTIKEWDFENDPCQEIKMKLTINSENAEKILSWLKDRGGVAVWNSIDLSDPSRQMLTPVNDTEGNKYEKPHWKMSSIPEIITDVNDITVSVDKEVKRFHVAVRYGSNGLSMKVSDGGSRRIRREVEKAGKDAYYLFDYGDYDNAVIMAPDKQMPLKDYENNT